MCVRERERVCVCVCERERDRRTDRQTRHRRRDGEISDTAKEYSSLFDSLLLTL